MALLKSRTADFYRDPDKERKCGLVATNIGMMGVFTYQEKEALQELFERKDEINVDSQKISAEAREKIIANKELKLERYKIAYILVENYLSRKAINEEKKLFEILNYTRKPSILLEYCEKKEIYSKKYKELKDFINSLRQDTIDSNIFLKTTQQFMEMCQEDCNKMLEELTIVSHNQSEKEKIFGIDIEYKIPEEKLKLIPLDFSGIKKSIPSSIPKRYKKLLDDGYDIYFEYQEIAFKLKSIIEYIYLLNLWNIASKYDVEIESSYFKIFVPEKKFKVNFKIKGRIQGKTIDNEINREDIINYYQEIERIRMMNIMELLDVLTKEELICLSNLLKESDKALDDKSKGVVRKLKRYRENSSTQD